MSANTGGDAPFASLYAYALHRPCPTCKAAVGTACDAPRKQASVHRRNAILQRFGRGPVGHDPLDLLHLPRVRAGARHRNSDIGRAPWPEEREEGRSYSTLGGVPGPRPVRKKKAAARDADLPTRAALVLGGSPGAVMWPYGLTTAPRSAYGSQEAYEMAVRDRLAARELLVAWAEEYGLRQSSAGCCPRWLGCDSSRRCRDGACAREADPALDSYWMDHPVSWLADGRPAAFTTAPYHFEDEARERLRWWTAQDSRLRGAWGTGWYGCGTVQVVLWRADLLGKVMPAGPEARAEGFCGQGVL